MDLLWRLMFITILDVLHFFTWAYKRLTGMAFRLTIPILISVVSSKTFCRGNEMTASQPNIDRREIWLQGQ